MSALRNEMRGDRVTGEVAGMAYLGTLTKSLAFFVGTCVCESIIPASTLVCEASFTPLAQPSFLIAQISSQERSNSKGLKPDRAEPGKA